MLHEKIKLEEQVTEILLYLGVPAHLKGYYCLRAAIMLAVNDAGILRAVTKKLYPTVAEIYNTTASRAERAMRHAVESAWKRSDGHAKRKYFGNTVTSHRQPTNSEFIAMVADRLALGHNGSGEAYKSLKVVQDRARQGAGLG